jgi:hypothetical protein
MARILLILSLSTLLAVALLVAVLLWGRLDSAEIGLHGALAMGLGAVLSLGLGGGLMALVFLQRPPGLRRQPARRPRRAAARALAVIAVVTGSAMP